MPELLSLIAELRAIESDLHHSRFADNTEFYRHTNRRAWPNREHVGRFITGRNRLIRLREKLQAQADAIDADMTAREKADGLHRVPGSPEGLVL
jgi:hypothetical protein